MKQFETSGLQQQSFIPQKNPEAFKCVLCGDKFSKMNKFKIHLLALHENNLEYSCNLCNCDLTSNRELFHHISVVHDGKRKENAICIKPITKSSQYNNDPDVEIVFDKKDTKPKSSSIIIST